MNQAPWREDNLLIHQSHLATSKTQHARVGCGLGGFGLFVSFFLALAGSWPIASAVLITAIGGFAFAIHNFNRAHDLRVSHYEEIKALRTATDGFVGEIRIYQGELLTAADRGVIWFEDHHLFFVGLQTSFGLEPRMLRPHRAKGLAIRHLSSPVEFGLAIETRLGLVRIGFAIESSQIPDAPYWIGENDFRRMLRDWKSLRPSEVNDRITHSLPLGLTHHLPTTSSLLWEALGSVGSWVMTLSFVGLLLYVNWVVGFGVGIVSAVIALSLPIFHHPILRIKAFRARRRIDTMR